jgi:hypothetical protein
MVDLPGEVADEDVEGLLEGGVVRLRRVRAVEVPHVVAAPVPGGVRM